MHTKFFMGNPKGRDQLGGLGIERRITLKYLKETGCEGVDWIHLAQDKLQWQTLVNMVTNLWVP